LHTSPDIRLTELKRLKWAGHVARIEEMRNARPRGRLRRRWEDNIGMDLREMDASGSG